MKYICIALKTLDDPKDESPQKKKNRKKLNDNEVEILGILEDIEWERIVESSDSELDCFVGVNKVKKKYSIEPQSYSSLSRDMCKLKVTCLRCWGLLLLVCCPNFGCFIQLVSMLFVFVLFQLCSSVAVFIISMNLTCTGMLHLCH